MAENENRRIFFLHPQAVIQDDLVGALLEDNYEALIVRNKSSARAAVREHRNAILLIQIDSGIDESRWTKFAAELKASPILTELTICVLSVRSPESIAESFLGDTSPFSHGFSYGDFDFYRTLAELKEYFTVQKARLPRNQVHGVAPEGLEIAVAFIRDGIQYHGTLRDITIAGLTCRIGQEKLLPSDVPMRAIDLSYKNETFRVVGRIAGNHGKEGSLHLILFDEQSKKDKRREIYSLIQTCLQAELDEVINEKGHKRQVATRVPRSELYRRKPQ